MLAWMDLEMTGLDPSRHVIVEIATLLTDDDLEVQAIGPQMVLQASPAQLDAMEEVVRTMHTRSGLLEAIARSDFTVEQAAAETLSFLKAHIATPRSVPLCGNSIATDRRFLAEQMPEVEEFLNYRSVDVSSIKELCRRWYPAQYGAAPAKATGHRALDDIKESIAELVYYRKTIFQPVPDPAAVEQAG